MSDPYDVVGIGIGPFDLGLAALLDGVEDVDALFLEQEESFGWHEGMLIDGATLEVPFLADLVTMADPTSPHSYLNYLKEQGRLYEFYFYETFQIPREEYNAYCKWVAEHLGSCRFGRRVTRVADDGDAFLVEARDPETGEQQRYRARNVVSGIGSRPHVPPGLRGHPDEDVFHSARYMDRRERCLDATGITVVGSGQSAAEVFLDLLRAQSGNDYRLDWLTRSEGFFPMEYSKLGLQHFTPEYVDYFYDLPEETKSDLLAEQDLLYKGIDPGTSEEIYDLLYERSIGSSPEVGMLANAEVRGIDALEDGGYRLRCEQRQEGVRFDHESEVVVLATGYRRPFPAFLVPIEDRIETTDGQPAVRRDYRLETEGLPGEVFVQNAEIRTHGVGTPDLGLGCHRNAVIANAICGREVYPVGEDTVFQDFSAEQFANHAPASVLDEPRAPLTRED